MVGKIKEVLDVDLTSDDSKGQLEEFKKAANAYGDLQTFSATEHLLAYVFGSDCPLLHVLSGSRSCGLSASCVARAEEFCGSLRWASDSLWGWPL